MESNQEHFDQNSFIIGLLLAISSSLFIGSSFIIKKIALRRQSKSSHLRASAGGFAYLKQGLWWLGFITMGIGEAANLIAYGFAPAALVTPLGALSVLVAAILASKFLKERLNFIGKIGCFLCVVGSTVIVIHSPKEEEIVSLTNLTEMLQNPVFLAYIGLTVAVFFSVVFYIGPKYGHKNVSVYIFLCSIVGSLTVVCCKGVAIAIRESFSGSVNNNFRNWIFWGLLFAAVFCISIQMNYLNKALDIFNTSIVTPVYYVMFTMLVIIASGILFKEWENIYAYDILGNICGFMVVIVAVFMLNAFKDTDLTLNDLNFSMRRKRESSFNEVSGDDHAITAINPMDRSNGIDTTYGTSCSIRNI